MVRLDHWDRMGPKVHLGHLDRMGHWGRMGPTVHWDRRVPTDQKDSDPPTGTVTVTGNLQWPQETDSFTPEPDLRKNIWFARDVPAMAAALDTREVLVVARAMSPGDLAWLC